MRNLTAKDLIEALKEFPPESEPFVVYHVKDYGAVQDEIGWVSDNNGRAQINSWSFCEEMEHVEELAARRAEDQRQLELFPIDFENVLAAL